MDRQSFIPSVTIRGIEALAVNVEVSVGSGLPGITIVGLPDSTVKEANLRVRAAIKAAGYTLPNKGVMVNLSPSSIRKVGAGFDLPIAVGILACTGQIPQSVVENSTFFGELSLDGSVHGVAGMFAAASLVARLGGRLVSGISDEDTSPIIGDRHLMVKNISCLREGVFEPPRKRKGRAMAAAEDYADIASHDFAKRALQVAAAGNHALLMVGPPGSGKTMLASRMGTIMPPLSTQERYESALIHSVAGHEIDSILAGVRPFRAPHHSATAAGIIGGGSPVSPGEVSLSHNGVLFLDELPEFGSNKLQILRQPIEEGQVVLARADGSFRFPARFLLIGACNPCPCGYLGDPEHECTCTPGAVSLYQGRIGGPIMDRFDMVLHVNRSDPKTVMQAGRGTPSAKLLEGVMAARDFASYRRSLPQPQASAALEAQGFRPTGRDARLISECRLSDKASACIERLAHAHRLSGRGIMKTLSVARTLADMEQRLDVSEGDISEAIMYRSQDR